MNEREQILGRVREALRVKAPLPGQAHAGEQGAAAGKGSSPANHAREWLPKVGEGPEAMFESFRKMAGDLKAEVLVVPDRQGMIEAVRAISAAGPWTAFATHTGDLTTGCVAPALGIAPILTDSGYDTLALEKCNAGITECDALVAQTGSVLITAASAGGRALSVLPPHHIVLSRRSQLVADLPAAFELLRTRYPGRPPSFVSFITGPSRTGDIERILVLGAHGPKRLTVIVLAAE